MRQMINAYGSEYGIEIDDDAVILSDWKDNPPETWEKRAMRTFGHPDTRIEKDVRTYRFDIPGILNQMDSAMQRLGFTVHDMGGTDSQLRLYTKRGGGGTIAVNAEIGNADSIAPDYQDIPGA